MNTLPNQSSLSGGFRRLLRRLGLCGPAASVVACGGSGDDGAQGGGANGASSTRPDKHAARLAAISAAYEALPQTDAAAADAMAGKGQPVASENTVFPAEHAPCARRSAGQSRGTGEGWRAGPGAIAVLAGFLQGGTDTAFAQARDSSPRAQAPGSRGETTWLRANALYDRHDYRAALPLYREAAALGDPRAMTVLGHIYREGQGVGVDKAQAAQWYERATQGGSRAAKFSLGDMLESGEGVSRDVRRAAQLYGESARQGFPEAQFALGISYEFGQGVPRDRRLATQWLDRAAAQGDGRAHWFSSWLKSSATPQFDHPDRLRDYVNGQVDARMRRQMGAGSSNCSMVPWVCSRERAEEIWKSEYHPPNTPNPYRN